MDVFNKHYIHSGMAFIGYEEFVTSGYKNTPEIKYTNIISVAFTEHYVIIEYIPDNKWQDYVADKQSGTNNNSENNAENKPKIPAEVKKAMATELNYDPFGMGLNGKTLQEIYKNYPEWVEKARNELKNSFILGKMEIIDKFLEV